MKLNLFAIFCVIWALMALVSIKLERRCADKHPPKTPVAQTDPTPVPRPTVAPRRPSFKVNVYARE